jgi:hypothetical protein
MAKTLIKDLESLAQSSAQFSCALAVFGLSQAGKVFKFWPTSTPTEPTAASFDATTAAIKEQYDSVDTTLFNTCNTIQQLALGSAFAAADPRNWTPQSLIESGTNLVRFGLGQAAQLIPGGKIGVGGEPVGWGPVNPTDASRLNTGNFEG